MDVVNSNPRLDDPVMKVHNIRIRKSDLDVNTKLSMWEEGRPCVVCGLPMDAGEGPVCKYCLPEYFEGDDDG